MKKSHFLSNSIPAFFLTYFATQSLKSPPAQCLRFLPRYGHFLPDSEFPLLKMKEPTVICGKYFFANSRVQLPEGKRCMTCHKAINHATVISCHDPNRSKDKGQRKILSIFRGYFQG